DILKGTSSRPGIVADLSVAGKWNKEVMEMLDCRQSDGEDKWLSGVKTPEMVYVEQVSDELAVLPEEVSVIVPAGLFSEACGLHASVKPFYDRDTYLETPEFSENISALVQIDSVEELDTVLAERLAKENNVTLVLSFGPEYHAYREVYRRMRELGLDNRTLLRVRVAGMDVERMNLEIASQVGGLFLDRLPDGLWISAPDAHSAEYGLELSRNILQSAGVRRYKAEFISCPGCGRTLFDLQGAVAKVKRAFGHLNALKIAVMGCVVNGPGEMGDADFGYVGAGNGKVNLYKGRRMVRAAVPEDEAIEVLRSLIEG
ncbi:MAG: flavodoxin-dependent (E)-4-hydroxy-3-methylbut-2-enyl-diphosphate synthase, partial [Odoribacter sp.]|nr:flavodoxin-dependent (E)-4-hydroxy-3-methylbut-2-enyl-diphosphate synthase [Odoribacter sp.]